MWSSITTGIIIVAYLAARITLGGQCPAVELQANFDIDQYLGKWYEIFRAESVPFGSDGDCAVVRYSRKDDGGVDVDNRDYVIATDSFRSDGYGIDESFGEAYCSDWTSGLCHVRFFTLTPWGNYEVLDTDYTSYSIVYSCTTSMGGAFRPRFMWVLTRDALVIGSPDHIAMKEKVNAIINAKVPDWFDDNVMRPTTQTVAEGCKYNTDNVLVP